MTRWSAITRTRARRSALAYGSRSTTGAETTSTGSYTTSGDATKTGMAARYGRHHPAGAGACGRNDTLLIHPGLTHPEGTGPLETSKVGASYMPHSSRRALQISPIVARARSASRIGTRRFPYAAFVASDRASAMTGAIANLTCRSLVGL